MASTSIELIKGLVRTGSCCNGQEAEQDRGSKGVEKTCSGVSTIVTRQQKKPTRRVSLHYAFTPYPRAWIQICLSSIQEYLSKLGHSIPRHGQRTCGSDSSWWPRPSESKP